MADLNASLTAADFLKDDVVRPDDRKGFKGNPRVVKLQGPFKLYKLTGDKAPQHPKRGVVTAWWSPVDPYLEDREGALGRFKQAYLNGIDMSSMVRYMSAVKIEWNSLAEYVEISIKRGDTVSCFWGEFAPMPLTSALVPDQSLMDTYGSTNSSALGYAPAELPPDLGALSAWQFFIPNLTDSFIESGAHGRKCVDAHDMGALGLHFGLDLGSTSDLGKAWSRLRFFYRDSQMGLSIARNARLKEMDACVNQLWDLTVSPRETLRRFCEIGDSYLASGSRDPKPVQLKVAEYLTEAKKPL